jgi:molybdenum cofactor biosynthesis enzyme MoaA
MTDSHGRTIRDLRISITDRCNFRCVYCMEPDVRFAPRESLLTVDEIVRVARSPSRSASARSASPAASRRCTPH